MQNQKKRNLPDSPASQGRRKVVKKIAAGAGLLAGYSVLPDRWIKPIVGQMALPAHAATSGPATASTAAAPQKKSAKTKYNSSKVYMLRSAPGNDKRYTWLEKTGSSYGGQVKFVFPGCGELVVPNAAETHGADGTKSNHNQAYYFCGTDFPKSAREYNAGKASVFSPPNCKADTVTMYYNK